MLQTLPCQLWLDQPALDVNPAAITAPERTSNLLEASSQAWSWGILSSSCFRMPLRPLLMIGYIHDRNVRCNAVEASKGPQKQKLRRRVAPGQG